MKDILKIKKQLPHGAQAEIAKIANVKPILVHRVLNGKSENLVVLNAIADYLVKLKEAKTAAANRLSSLID